MTPGFPRRLQVSCPKLVIAQCSLTREDGPGAADRRTGFVALLSLGNLIVASLSRPNFQPLKRGSDKWIREGGEKDLPILSHYVFTILVLVHPCHIVGRRMNSAAHTTEFDPIQPYPTIIAMFSQHLNSCRSVRFHMHDAFIAFRRRDSPPLKPEVELWCRF